MPIVPFGVINPQCRPEPLYEQPEKWDDPTHRPLEDLDVEDIRRKQRGEVRHSRAFQDRMAESGGSKVLPLVVVLEISAELYLHPYCVECRLLEMGYSPEAPPSRPSRKATAGKGAIARIAAALAGGKRLTSAQLVDLTGIEKQKVDETLRKAFGRFRRDNLASGPVRWHLYTPTRGTK